MLSNKVVAITGAGGVICSAFAKELAKHGAKVALLDINYDAAKVFADEIGENAFLNCKTLKNVQFPSTLQRIEKSAFSGCSAISMLTLPANLKFIGENAFDGLVLLREITLPSTLEEIGASAFANCTRLTEITVPNIKLNGVFKGCNIATIYFDGTKEEAQTYICKAFPYGSYVLIHCSDGDIQQ